jgi:hypothetical protein
MDKIPPKAMRSAKNEAALAYMSSSDSELILSYLDVYDLFDLIEQHWDIFEPSLLDKQVWLGRVKELRQIRHRSAHCRRPHVDDLTRVEQTLRDLEGGAFRALSSFNKLEMPDPSLDDPLVEAWVRGEHPTARRLISHAESNYDVTFRLAFSCRPWAPSWAEGASISGQIGYLWHAIFNLHAGGFELPRFWQDTYVDRPGTKNHIVFLCSDSPSHAGISFSALDDPTGIANAIGNCFDAIIDASRYGWSGDKAPRALDQLEDMERWAIRGARLGPRVQAMTAWAFVDESTTPISLFAS